MPATVTPTGRVAKAKVGLAYLVASSSTFQTVCGVPSATAAMNRIHAQADDTPYSVEFRPRAIIAIAEHEENKLALDDFRMTLRLYLAFEFPPSASVLGKEWDEETEFHNRLDAITSEMFAIQGEGTGYIAGQSHVAFRRISWLGGGAVQDTTDAGDIDRPAYYYAAEYVVEVDA